MSRRAGGSGVACKQRHMTMGEILGDCFTKQFQRLRALKPMPGCGRGRTCSTRISLGFTTAAGAYYDGATLDNPQGWLEMLDRTKGAVGIMYTTWQDR